MAAQKKLFEEEGVKTPDFVVPGGGAKVVQALAAGQVQFALGDSNHPLKITEKGKDALMVFATDTRCSYANIVVRKELWDKGLRTVEALEPMAVAAGWRGSSSPTSWPSIRCRASPWCRSSP